MDSVCWCVGLSASGLYWEYWVWGLGVVSEVTGKSEFGSVWSSAVFTGRPGCVCDSPGLIVGGWSFNMGLSEPLGRLYNKTAEDNVLKDLTGKKSFAYVLFNIHY